MRFCPSARLALAAVAVCTLVCQAGLAQGTPAQGATTQADPTPAAPASDARSDDPPNIAARATPGDYPSQAKAGNFTIAAEFKGHSVPTPQAVFSTEDYVVVEIALFGPPESRLTISNGDFSLRINGKKVPVTAEPYAVVFQSLKDPEWEPTAASTKAKNAGISTGATGDTSATPAPVHMPIELKRAMQQKVQKASLREGERTLPEAGLLYFQHHGKVDNIRSIELIYGSTAGKAVLTLQH